MKKALAFLTAAVLTVCTAGCGSEIEKRKKTGATLEVDLANSYITEQVSFLSKRAWMEFSTENGVLMAYLSGSVGQGYHLVFWDAQTEEFTEVALHDPEKRHGSGTVFALPDGRIGVMYQNTSSGIKGWYYEKENAYIDVYNSDFSYAETLPFSLETGGAYASNFMYVNSGGKGYYLYRYRYDSEDIIMILDEAFQYVGEITVPGDYAELFLGASGTAYAAIPLDINHKTYIYDRVNIEQRRLEPLDLKIESRYCDSHSGSGVLTGTCGYEFYSYGSYGLCGVTNDGDTWQTELVMDLRNSDFPDGYWLDVGASPDGRFLIRDDNDKNNYMWLCHKRSEEELASTQVISMAGVGFNDQLRNVVQRFNRNHTDYHIMMVDYTQYVDSYEPENYDNSYDEYMARLEAEEKDKALAADIFMEDLIGGIAPDIICTDNLPYVQLANKGLFLDMTELMEQDERFRDEDYVMSFFDAMKYKGEQQTIAFSFLINTISGKSELVGEKTGLTPEEFVNLLNSCPENMLPFQEFFWQADYKERFLPYVQNSFLNTETITCSFDSPAFVRLLELGNTLYREDDVIDSETEQKKEKLLQTRSFNQPINYRELYVKDYHPDAMTLVGYPAADGGNGCIFSAPYAVGINAMSNYAEIVWDVFMELLSEDTQRLLDADKDTYSFPVLRSALEEDMLVSTKGSRVHYTTTIGSNSEEDVAFLMDYIEHATMFYYCDRRIMDVILEEADMYYAGDQTAEEAAKMIQSRVSIYLSEQY